MIIARPSESLPSPILPVASTSPPATSPTASASASSSKATASGQFSRVLRGLGRELDSGEALSERAIQGGSNLSPGGLIALQAGIYRYSETVDLLSKLVDRGTQSVKTVLQAQ